MVNWDQIRKGSIMVLPRCTLSYFQPPASAPSIFLYSVLVIIKSLVEVVLMTLIIDSASKYYLDNISRLSHKDCQGTWTVDIRISQLRSHD